MAASGNNKFKRLWGLILHISIKGVKIIRAVDDSWYFG